MIFLYDVLIMETNDHLLRTRDHTRCQFPTRQAAESLLQTLIVKMGLWKQHILRNMHPVDFP